MIPEVWIAPLPLADILYAFKTSNFVSGKLIVITLFVASVFGWTFMVSKYMDVRYARRSSMAFRERLRREKHPLSLYLNRAQFAESPMYRIYVKACDAVGIEMEAEENDPVLITPALEQRRTLSPLQINAVRNAAEREIADQCMRMEKRMGLLATTVSASPMLGLLGTVWGVLDAFSSMATQGAANLSAVAPGIASALMTTVVGLIVALPSAVGYNLIAGQLKEMTVELDNFGDEFLSEIQRVFVRNT